MSAKSEQDQEIEILLMAYPNEVEVVNSEFPNIELKEYECAEPDFYVTITIKLPEDYPTSSSPEFEIEGFSEDFPQKGVEEVYANVRNAAQTMLGFPVVMSMINEVQHTIPDVRKRIEREKDDEERRQRDAKEEAERKRFEGNRITVASFNVWREKFEKEFLAAEIAARKAKQSELAGKLTGKQQFLRDATLCMSDLGLVDKEGEDAPIEDDNVEIDQALFAEDLSDLDISDEEDDD